MKLTLLELVQLILSDGDSDEVNSISDTTEALQVANIVKETYIDIISRANLPEHYTLFELEASGDSNFPCIMYLPSDIVEVNWIKYNNYDSALSTSNPFYQEVKWQSMDEFLQQMHALDTNNTNVATYELTIEGDTIDLLWENDAFPSRYTTIDDYTLLFNSYKSTIDTTLQKNKTSCYGMREPTFTLTDSFTPDLDSKQFSLLLQEAKDQYFTDLKQTENPKAKERARRGWINFQRQGKSLPDTFWNRLPDYGRK